MASTSRAADPVYLLGTYIEEIKGLKLPSKRQVVGYF